MTTSPSSQHEGHRRGAVHARHGGTDADIVFREVGSAAFRGVDPVDVLVDVLDAGLDVQPFLTPAGCDYQPRGRMEG